jgi:hypothetical protein
MACFPVAFTDSPPDPSSLHAQRYKELVEKQRQIEIMLAKTADDIMRARPGTEQYTRLHDAHSMYLKSLGDIKRTTTTFMTVRGVPRTSRLAMHNLRSPAATAPWDTVPSLKCNKL